MAPPGEGSYQVGFQITPLMQDGSLDTSGDFKGGPHAAEEDPLFKMAVENREGGNKMVAKGEYEMAIGRYSEMIMQLRALENEVGIEWTDDGRLAVRQQRASAYLNLSLCFIKTEQWTHASNTATRALQGDKDPPDPKEDVLAPEKKAKALFRRAQAQSQGFGNYAKALDDLKQALHYTPDDKAIQAEVGKMEKASAKAAKAADKKLAGFLSGAKKVKNGEGLFDDSLRPEEGWKAKPPPKEPVKMSDGLWVMPGVEEKKDEAPPSEDKVDFDELSRELNELKEDNPEEYTKLREKVQKKLEEEIAEMDRKEQEAAEHGDAERLEDASKVDGNVDGEAVDGEATAVLA
mmetsp:Transcript_60318/g.174088  ORF Transcript_60318/g.174088 Transcript_60318/m.174088 type:complete len:348 (+) Transcript_60318:75-1118(+)